MAVTRKQTRTIADERPEVVRVALYLRQSYDAALRKQTNGAAPKIDEKETEIRRAVRRQHDACLKWIKSHTTPERVYKLVEVYEDNDKSASKVNRKRPDF